MITNAKFEQFLSELKETNTELSFYSDFKKIEKNVTDVAYSLNILNFLIGKKDISSAVSTIWERDKKAFEVMDILIATRKKDKKQFLNKHQQPQTIHSLFKSPEGIVHFLEETGLADIFRQQKIKDLVDYVFGVETGLDSNSRKNRNGFIMENRVASLLDSNSIPYKTQVSSYNYPTLKKSLGEDQKIFDFAITTPKKTYFIEVNFYSGGGSKLNEIARAYTDIAPKINSTGKYEFVWLTDGKGWISAKNKLKEAFSSIPSIYNLTTFKKFILKVKKELS